jgi:SOS response regulatory protein OraA/RecX
VAWRTRRGEAGDAGAAACRERALRLLAARSHFRRELASKLASRGFASAEVTATLDALAAQGYLDDERTAVELVRERRERRGWGRARLQAELQRRGAPAGAVDSALAGIGSEDDLALARQAAARLLRRGAAQPAALARHLARKGFSQRAILAVLEDTGAAEGVAVEDLDEPAAD